MEQLGKNERIIAPRVMYVLDQNLGIGMRFNKVYKTLVKNGWFHNQRSLIENLRYLMAQGKIAHIGNQYALIQTREDGTKFVIVKNPVETVIEVEK